MIRHPWEGLCCGASLTARRLKINVSNEVEVKMRGTMRHGWDPNAVLGIAQKIAGDVSDDLDLTERQREARRIENG